MANVYVRTEKKNDKVLKGQAALVMEALENAAGPATVEQLTEDIKGLGLVTRQAPERITSYYLCIFKKQGFVRVEQVSEEAPAAEETEDVEENEEEFAEVE